MPEADVNREKLLTQLKESHGKVVYTYTAHHKIADRAKQWLNILEIIEIVITAFSAVGLLSGFITDETAVKFIGGLSSAVALAITLYTKDDSLQTKIQAHTDAANELWLVREKYQSLITDFDRLNYDQIQSTRDEIMLVVDSINRKYPGTSKWSYKKAQDALKNDGEQTFEPGEADRLLPNSHQSVERNG